MLNREELDVSRKKIHCQPCNSPFPSNLSNAAPSNGETAAPPNIPKKKTAMRLVNSSLVYHVERVYIAAGIYPASEKPKMLRVSKKPVLFRMKICSAAMTPKMHTWELIQQRGPT